MAVLDKDKTGVMRLNDTQHVLKLLDIDAGDAHTFEAEGGLKISRLREMLTELLQFEDLCRLDMMERAFLKGAQKSLQSRFGLRSKNDIRVISADARDVIIGTGRLAVRELKGMLRGKKKNTTEHSEGSDDGARRTPNIAVQPASSDAGSDCFSEEGGKLGQGLPLEKRVDNALRALDPGTGVLPKEEVRRVLGVLGVSTEETAAQAEALCTDQGGLALSRLHEMIIELLTYVSEQDATAILSRVAPLRQRRKRSRVFDNSSTPSPPTSLNLNLVTPVPAPAPAVPSDKKDRKAKKDKKKGKDPKKAKEKAPKGKKGVPPHASLRETIEFGPIPPLPSGLGIISTSPHRLGAVVPHKPPPSDALLEAPTPTAEQLASYTPTSEGVVAAAPAFAREADGVGAAPERSSGAAGDDSFVSALAEPAPPLPGASPAGLPEATSADNSRDPGRNSPSGIVPPAIERERRSRARSLPDTAVDPAATVAKSPRVPRMGSPEFEPTRRRVRREDDSPRVSPRGIKPLKRGASKDSITASDSESMLRFDSCDSAVWESAEENITDSHSRASQDSGPPSHISPRRSGRSATSPRTDQPPPIPPRKPPSSTGCSEDDAGEDGTRGVMFSRRELSSSHEDLRAVVLLRRQGRPPTPRTSTLAAAAVAEDETRQRVATSAANAVLAARGIAVPRRAANKALPATPADPSADGSNEPTNVDASGAVSVFAAEEGATAGVSEKRRSVGSSPTMAIGSSSPSVGSVGTPPVFALSSSESGSSSDGGTQAKRAKRSSGNAKGMVGESNDSLRRGISLSPLNVESTSSRGSMDGSAPSTKGAISREPSLDAIPTRFSEISVVQAQSQAIVRKPSASAAGGSAGSVDGTAQVAPSKPAASPRTVMPPAEPIPAAVEAQMLARVMQASDQMEAVAGAAAEAEPDEEDVSPEGAEGGQDDGQPSADATTRAAAFADSVLMDILGPGALRVTPPATDALRVHTTFVDEDNDDSSPDPDELAPIGIAESASSSPSPTDQEEPFRAAVVPPLARLSGPEREHQSTSLSSPAGARSPASERPPPPVPSATPAANAAAASGSPRRSSPAPATGHPLVRSTTAPTIIHPPVGRQQSAPVGAIRDAAASRAGSVLPATAGGKVPPTGAPAASPRAAAPAQTASAKASKPRKEVPSDDSYEYYYDDDVPAASRAGTSKAASKNKPSAKGPVAAPATVPKGSGLGSPSQAVSAEPKTTVGKPAPSTAAAQSHALQRQSAGGSAAPTAAPVQPVTPPTTNAAAAKTTAAAAVPQPRASSAPDPPSSHTSTQPPSATPTSGTVPIPRPRPQSYSSSSSTVDSPLVTTTVADRFARDVLDEVRHVDAVVPRATRRTSAEGEPGGEAEVWSSSSSDSH